MLENGYSKGHVRVMQVELFPLLPLLNLKENHAIKRILICCNIRHLFVLKGQLGQNGVCICAETK